MRGSVTSQIIMGDTMENSFIDKYFRDMPVCQVCKKEKATCMLNTACPDCVKVLIKNLAGGRPINDLETSKSDDSIECCGS